MSKTVVQEEHTIRQSGPRTTRVWGQTRPFPVREVYARPVQGWGGGLGGMYLSMYLGRGLCIQYTVQVRTHIPIDQSLSTRTSHGQSRRHPPRRRVLRQSGARMSSSAGRERRTYTRDYTRYLQCCINNTCAGVSVLSGRVERPNRSRRPLFLRTCWDLVKPPLFSLFGFFFPFFSPHFFASPPVCIVGSGIKWFFFFFFFFFSGPASSVVAGNP